MIFYLGTHKPGWLARMTVPLCVSYRQLKERKQLPKATCRWILDSGGFSEIQEHGRWTVPAKEYAKVAERYRVEIGNLDWAACQDWMCEPFMLEKTGKSIPWHQHETCNNFALLKVLAPKVPWLPVLQGWTVEDYVWHVRLYSASGIDLTKEPVVGVGSVCRRQDTKAARLIVRELRSLGIKMHLFGAKSDGLAKVADRIVSADSMAWSFTARYKQIRLPECSHARCNNCPRFALKWRDDVLAKLERPPPPEGQTEFWD